MSSTVFSQENSSTIPTRRTVTRNDDIENNTQRQKNNRSLSSKFRNLFRKNSASPNRHSTNERIPSPQPATTTRRQSSSPEPVHTSTESPLLRAPLVDWPFGKKKTRSPSEPKPKKSRKSKKKSLPPVETTTTIRTNEYGISTNGQTFVPSTPEPVYDGTMGRTHSPSSYETETRGFRDYTIIDNSKPSHQIITSNIDVTTPPLYTSDLRRSPIFDQHNVHYGNIDYPRRYDVLPTPLTNKTITNLEIIPGPRSQRQVNSTLQNLVDSTPTLPQTSVYPSSGTFTTNSDQWKVGSTTSLDDSERYSSRPFSAEVDVPKLHSPTISFGNRPSKTESKLTDPQFHSNETYHASSVLNKYDRPYINTYSSLSDTEIVSKSNDKTYPWLSAIVQHHMRPTSTSYTNDPWILPSTYYQNHRFDASTTTFRRPNSRESSSPIDGYIRPLSPSKSPIQPDVTVIHIDPLGDIRSGSRTSYTTSSDIPIIYRSSATIYTRDKQNFNNGGEIRTSSLRDKDDLTTNQKSSTSIYIDRTPTDHQVVPSKVSSDSSYKSKLYGTEFNNYNDQKGSTYSPEYDSDRRQHQQYFYDGRYYSSSHYSDSTIDNRNYTRSPISSERDNNYDRSIHLYKDTDQTQGNKSTYF